MTDPDIYTFDEEIRPLVLPAATGGSGMLSYSLGPKIPPGLTFDAGDLIADKLMTDGPRGWPGRGRTCTRCPCSTTARSRRTRTCTPRSGATPEPSA